MAAAGTPGSKVRCKVNSRSVRGAPGARHFAVDPGFLGGLCVPLDVQARADGPQGVLMSNLFSLNVSFQLLTHPNRFETWLGINTLSLGTG